MQKPFVVFLSCLFGERDLLSIPKPYTLNNKEAKMESNSFTQNTRKVSSVCLCLSFAVLSLSLSVKVFGSLEAHTFEEEELRFLQTRSLERLRNNKL
jgi:hypothetical protein